MLRGRTKHVHATPPSKDAAPAATDDASLIAMTAEGAWFLKHRKGGEKPHRRFVFTHEGAVYWATREDRGGSAAVPADCEIISGHLEVP